MDNLYKQEQELLKRLNQAKSEEEREAIGRVIKRINEEMKALDELRRYISIPFALKILRDDRESFKQFKSANVYLDKLDPVIDQLEKDFYKLKVTYNQVRKMDGGRYKFKGEEYEFTPDELKQETSEIMEDYLFTVKAEHKERIWRDMEHEVFKG